MLRQRRQLKSFPSRDQLMYATFTKHVGDQREFIKFYQIGIRTWADQMAIHPYSAQGYKTTVALLLKKGTSFVVLGTVFGC